MLGSNKIDWLIAGLGNPGPVYEKTRHNIGWMVLDHIAEKFNKEFTHSMYFNAFQMTIHDNNLGVVKPNIFMNNSGEPIKRIMDKYEIPTERLLVIHDEINFPIGKVHLRAGGSDGGHNGIGSIIEKLDTVHFLRLRCGIDKDFESGDMVDYVLSEFLPNQTAEVRKMIAKAADAVETLISFGLSKAMQLVNTEKLDESETT